MIFGIASFLIPSSIAKGISAVYVYTWSDLLLSFLMVRAGTTVVSRAIMSARGLIDQQYSHSALPTLISQRKHDQTISHRLPCCFFILFLKSNQTESAVVQNQVFSFIGGYRRYLFMVDHSIRCIYPAFNQGIVD